jgi:outer membrane protein with beta-barrel domain
MRVGSVLGPSRLDGREEPPVEGAKAGHADLPVAPSLLSLNQDIRITRGSVAATAALIGDTTMITPVRRALFIASFAALGLGAGARQARAQGLTPYAGIYVPTNNSFSSVGTDIKRNNAFVGGARLTFWGKSPLGLELSGAFSPANVDVAGATVNGTRSTSVFLASAKLMLGVSSAVSPMGFFVGAGPALIRRGDDVTQQSNSQTDFGGVVGAGLHFPIGGALGLRLEGEDYMYGGDFGTGNEFQNDLVLDAGLTIGL